LLLELLGVSSQLKEMESRCSVELDVLEVFDSEDEMGAMTGWD
jgi:hypothetical protein